MPNGEVVWEARKEGNDFIIIRVLGPGAGARAKTSPVGSAEPGGYR
jgi:hypothetical protein